MNNEILKTTEDRMNHTIANFDNRLATIRAGRANTALVEGVMVNCYGSMMPLNNVATITVADARQLVIRPFDKSSLSGIEKAIFEADLGLTPNNNGEAIFITVPPLTEERRKEFVKQAKSMGEEAKIALRNIRQDSNTTIKNLDISEDDKKGLSEDIQTLITKFNSIVDKKLDAKENELMTV